MNNKEETVKVRATIIPQPNAYINGHRGYLNRNGSFWPVESMVDVLKAVAKKDLPKPQPVSMGCLFKKEEK